MGYFTRRKNTKPGTDTDALILKAEASLRKTESQQPHVDKLTYWLHLRDKKNGFGEDFEFSTIPKRRSA